MSHAFEEVIITDDGEEMRLNEEGGGMLNMENEKRMRREIANSNERRRMQSINAGFQSLRSLLPHHEGEKLSKAAILQQTAQYIIELEREKTLLLSQNCQLKRLVDQQETSEIHIKKRKMDPVFTLQTISDSSDEGLGSMSPEPITLLTTTNGKTTTLTATPKEIVELKNLLEAERRQKNALEDRLRQIELQIFPERSRDVAVTYQHQEVIEHTDNVREEDVTVSIIQDPLGKIRDMESISVVSMESLPTIGQTQVVVCSHGDDDLVDEDSRTASPCDIEIEDNLVQIKQESAAIASRPNTPIEHSHNKRVQPILEAAIKAEPKVEVERINAPTSAGLIIVNEEIKSNSTTQNNIATTNKVKAPRSRMYITNTSRQNLETIVEAIRHLEGDQFVTDMVEQPQEAPLALTNKPQRQLQIEMNPFLQFRTQGTQQTVTTAPTLTTVVTSNNAKTVTSATVSHLQQQQQSRPGVIVVKQSS